MDAATESRIERLLMMERIRGVERADLLRVVNQVYHTEEPAPRPRNFTEWKAQRAARAGGVNLTTYGVGEDGELKKITPLMPAWDAYVADDRNLSPFQRAIRDGRVPRERLELARKQGAKAYNALRHEILGDDKGAA